MIFIILPKWKKDAKEFTVGINFNESRGYQSSIPKPIMDALGEPETIKFEINGNSVKISSGDKPQRSTLKAKNS